MINSSPWGSSRSAVALRVLRALLESGATVVAVYFRGDGVYHALPGRQTDAGADKLHEAYESLALAHGFELLLCSAAGARRLGPEFAAAMPVADEEAADTAPWREAGLARWAELLDDSDRLVSF